MCTCVVFTLVACQIFLPRVDYMSYASWAILSHTQKYLISIYCKCCCSTVLFAMSMAVALLQCTSVLGCGWPYSLRVIRNIISSLQFKKRGLSSALAADAMTNLRMAHKVKNAPFNLMGLPSVGVKSSMKKCPQALLRVCVSERYDPSKWTFIIMSDTLNQIFALGLDAR